MKEHLGSRILFNRHTQREVPSEIYRGLDDHNLRDVEHLWMPNMISGQLAGAGATRAPDSHWNWAANASAADRVMSKEVFAIEAEGQTQGLMLLDSSHFAKLPEQKGRELVLIEYVATAPWNRRTLASYPKFKGVGQTLLALAIELSLELEFKGRIGLYSLPDACSYYRESGFTAGDFDPANQTQYFEMTEARAIRFRS